MKTLRLIVLLPPQDSEIKIITLRSYIFSECGFASALALPVIIPLCPVPVDLPVDSVKKNLQAQSFSGCSITSSKLTDIAGSLFLAVEGGSDFDDLTAKCRDMFSHHGSDMDRGNEKMSFPCFPLYSGFYLACNEQNIDEKKIIENIPAFPVLHFSHFFISLLSLNIYSGIEKWWENIEWEIPIQVKCRQ